MVNPEGVSSILDTDLYKLTMQCVIHLLYPDTHVSYAFKNRTPHLRLSQAAFTWLQSQVERLSNIELSSEEHDYLRTQCSFLDHAGYLDFIKSFRFRPSEHVKLEFSPVEHGDLGDLAISVSGLWIDTILYEIPLLALVSEAYFKFCDVDWTYDGQREKAYKKGTELLENGCIFSEFGTRRRRDYKTQELVLEGLIEASQKVNSEDGKLAGTSNVHFAMRYGIPPSGTVAHEWFMGVAACSGDYKNATEIALRGWIECFGRKTMGVSLTDTFGTPVFLEAFSRKIPGDKMAKMEGWDGTSLPTYAEAFAGVRQDSGKPARFIKIMRKYYDDMGISERKTIVFSDSLNVALCLRYKKLSEKRGFLSSFGIGTFLTNDFTDGKGNKSVPLNIVIKLSAAGGRPAVKLSDDLGKFTGDQATADHIKEELGYVERHWDGADEASRWASNATNAVGDNDSDEDE